MKVFIWLLAIVVLLIVSYNIWASSGKDYNFNSSPPPVGDIISQGTDSGRGNLVGIQPYLTPYAYCDEQHFRDALDPYFKKAKSQGYLNQNSVVVLPEYIGTWLMAANEKATVYTASTSKAAISVIVNSNIFTFIKELLTTSSQDKLRHALYSMKAKEMAHIYEVVFSSLARDYKTTIVAGSIVLPDPSVSAAGGLQIGSGRLFNASFVFGSNGRLLSRPIKKVFLTTEEKKFTIAGLVDSIPVIATPAGKLAVLISTDSWHPELYQAINGKANILAVPSEKGLDSAWSSAWKQRDSSAALPASDTSAADSNNDEKWSRYGMGKLTVRSGIHNGINVFFAGRLWDINTEGRIISLQQNLPKIYEPVNGTGRIVNVWLQ